MNYILSFHKDPMNSWLEHWFDESIVSDGIKNSEVTEKDYYRH